ncbi:MAG: PEP-CTERM sorting domain-containing protein [Rubrivivax sp.]|nr:PEP-CTERM sorting domain-containing protein [Rubrivivax sp.]
MIFRPASGLRAAAAALACGGAMALAHAAPVVVDPDAFAPGTDLSNAFAGITLSAVGLGFGGGPAIFAVDSLSQPAEPFTASTGRLVFGTSAPTFPHLFREPSFHALRVDFAAPTDAVWIDFISNDSADTGFLQAFDAADNLLGTYTTASLTANQFETMSLSFGSASIAYILASGLDSASSGGLDHLRYNDDGTVPEPAALLLVGTALLALRLSRRPAR